MLCLLSDVDCSLRECTDVLLSYDTGDELEETLSVVPSRSVVLQVRIVGSYLEKNCNISSQTKTSSSWIYSLLKTTRRYCENCIKFKNFNTE